MPKSYEHLRLDISPRALEVIGEILERGYSTILEQSVRIEVSNFINECRARLQHVVAGEPDISEGSALPGRSDTEEEWLDE